MSESILDSWWFFFTWLNRYKLLETCFVAHHILLSYSFWFKLYLGVRIIATDIDRHTIVLWEFCASFYQFSHYHIFFLLCELIALNAFVYSIFPLNTHTHLLTNEAVWIMGFCFHFRPRNSNSLFFVRVNSLLFALFFIC